MHDSTGQLSSLSRVQSISWGNVLIMPECMEKSAKFLARRESEIMVELVT